MSPQEAEQEQGDVEHATGTKYEKPVVSDFGSIADHTFLTPGGNPKGCKVNCHTDKKNEQSGIATP